MDNDTTSIKRPDFIKRLMEDCGLTYDKATAAYESIVGLVGDGMAENRRICFGRVCSLQPQESAPRTVVLGAKRAKGGEYRKTNLKFWIDKRVRYRVAIYQEFIRKRALNLF